MSWFDGEVTERAVRRMRENREKHPEDDGLEDPPEVLLAELRETKAKLSLARARVIALQARLLEELDPRSIVETHTFARGPLAGETMPIDVAKKVAQAIVDARPLRPVKWWPAIVGTLAGVGVGGGVVWFLGGLGVLLQP